MGEPFDVRWWAVRVAADGQRSVFVLPAAEMGGERAVWDPLTASLEVAEDLTAAEAAEAERQLPELDALDLEDARPVQLTGADGAVVEMAAVRAARMLAERAGRLMRAWRALT